MHRGRVFGYIWIAALALSGCAAPYAVDAPEEPPLADELFPGFADAPRYSVADVFRIDQNMRSQLEAKVQVHTQPEERIKALVFDVIGELGVTINYDLAANTNAIDTFYSREANCLSLSIMGYALAREAGIEARFQRVILPAYWLSLGSYSARTSHINVLLSAKTGTDSYRVEHVFELDFSPQTTEPHFERQEMTERQVIALLYTNQAVEYLMQEEFSRAYGLLREALQFDDRNADLWVNLGVLYRQSGHEELALQSYRHALRLDRDNSSAANNYIRLMESLGRGREVIGLKRHLEQERKNNPYYHAHLGSIALARGDAEQARSSYARALAIGPKVHRFYAGLALSYSALDAPERAREYWQKAITTARLDSDRQSYRQQLEALGSQVSGG